MEPLNLPPLLRTPTELPQSLPTLQVSDSLQPWPAAEEPQESPHPHTEPLDHMEPLLLQLRPTELLESPQPPLTETPLEQLEQPLDLPMAQPPLPLTATLAPLQEAAMVQLEPMDQPLEPATETPLDNQVLQVSDQAQPTEQVEQAANTVPLRQLQPPEQQEQAD